MYNGKIKKIWHYQFQQAGNFLSSNDMVIIAMSLPTVIIKVPWLPSIAVDHETDHETELGVQNPWQVVLHLPVAGCDN